MIITAHQPAYLPWLGYFDKILKSDIYVFMDTVQYEDRSFINRNKIKTSQETMWLSVPVKSKGYRKTNLLSMEIDNSQNWRKKHLNAIWLNYKKAARFEELYPRLEKLYLSKHDLLIDLCYEQLLFWLGEMGISKKIVHLSELEINSSKSDLILDICKALQAKQYISGALGKNYLEEEAFAREGIEIIYQDYRHPVYPQLWGDFVPNMSILDFWMNTADVKLIISDNKF